MNEDEGATGRPLPRVPWSNHLIFGVVATAPGLMAALTGVLTVMGVLEDLWLSGVQWFGAVGPETDTAVVYGALLGPWLLTGALTAARVRWWLGPLLGLSVGGLVSAGMWMSGPGWSSGVAAGVQGGWLGAGLAGGLFAAARRRWRF